MRRYAAKLLFQYRVVKNGVSNRRRVCEERIVNCSAANARTALDKVKRTARSCEHSYENSAGGRVHVEFVGVLQLIHLFVPENAEVWHELVDRITPMERKAELVPPTSALNAVHWERNSKQPIGDRQGNYRPIGISRGGR